ncbi:MAG: prepilin-type N-terminal cleavage/methylation domain-containing protein [Nitrospirae bacterium]|nr:prepilin-type N-terminal cleavage/methylation domain-containing protein [Nitrospirota bacterium]
MRHRPNPNRSPLAQAGFTLIEMMVVVAVLAIMTGIAIPNVLAWMPAVSLKNETNAMLGAMQRARSLAINNGLEHRVLFDYANQTYQVDKGDLMSGSTNWTTAWGPEKVGDNYFYAPWWQMENEGANRPFLRFTANGSAVASIDQPYLITYNTHGLLYIAWIQRRTGHVTLEKRTY